MRILLLHRIIKKYHNPEDHFFMVRSKGMDGVLCCCCSGSKVATIPSARALFFVTVLQAVKNMLQKVFSLSIRPKSSVLVWLVIDKSASFFSEWSKPPPPIDYQLSTNHQHCQYNLLHDGLKTHIYQK